MITHENLLQAIYEDSHDWSCDGYLACKVDIDCISCCENKLIEYENALREEGKQMALADLAEHDKEVRNKTIEEIEDIVDEINNQGLHCIDDYCDDDNHDCAECFAKAIIGSLARMKSNAEYGKEQK